MPSEEKEMKPEDLKEFEGSEEVKGSADVVQSVLDKMHSEASTSKGAMDRMRSKAIAKATGGDPFPEDKSKTFEDIDGDGGYKYRLFDTGEVRILQAPGGRGEGLLLKRGGPEQKAYEAIIAELRSKGAKGSVSVSPAGSEPTEDQGVVARAKERADQAVADEQREGAVAAEGRETAQRNAQIGTTVGKGKLDVKMAKEEMSRDMARGNAREGQKFAMLNSDDPDAIMTAAKAEAYKLLDAGSALEAAAVLNEAGRRVEALRRGKAAEPEGGDEDVVARAVKSRREAMGI